MKVRKFTQEEYERYSDELWNNDMEHPLEQLDLIEHNGRLSADVTTEGKYLRSAVKRFVKTIHEADKRFGSWWEESILEAIEAGYYEEHQVEDCGFSWGVEEIGYGFYIYLNIDKIQWEA